MENTDYSIETYSGNRFDYSKLEENEYDIRDIAHCLSLQCRYNGHCLSFYSVAEHCCHVSDTLYKEQTTKTLRETIALAGLMHDATEAYVGDVVAPLKRLLPQFKSIENDIAFYIEKTFGYAPFHHDDPVIKDVDMRILVEEHKAIMGGDNLWATDSLKPTGAKIQLWSPREAEDRFLTKFYNLRGEINSRILRDKNTSRVAQW